MSAEILSQSEIDDLLCEICRTGNNPLGCVGCKLNKDGSSDKCESEQAEQAERYSPLNKEDAAFLWDFIQEVTSEKEKTVDSKERALEIITVIRNCLDAKLEIPKGWLEELNYHVKQLR